MDNASPFPQPIQPPVALSGPAAAGFERRDRGGLRRLRDMRFAEIAYRGWHEASKWLERVASAEEQAVPGGPRVDGIARQHWIETRIERRLASDARIRVGPSAKRLPIPSRANARAERPRELAIGLKKYAAAILVVVEVRVLTARHGAAAEHAGERSAAEILLELDAGK